ncbi:MAG: DUF6259 domain-containing protein [Saccharofermentanales bacterium]
MEIYKLENDNLLLEFDISNGTLVGITAKKSGWAVLDRPKLGLSFQLLLPLPGRRNNPVLGEKQLVSAFKPDIGQNSVEFTWNDVTSEYGGKHDIKVRQNIKLTERQAIFSITIENDSDYTIENVYFPYFGDIAHPKDSDWFKSFYSQYASSSEHSIWPVYQNTRGYYGVDHPIQICGWSAAAGTPMAPYILLRGSNYGLYIGAARLDAELVAWQTELLPGYGSSIDERVPTERSIGGKEVSTRFAAMHIPYILPGEKRELTPVAVEAFEGDWHKGVDIYKELRANVMKLPESPKWAKEPHSWQQLHINSPEDELRIKFVDLPEIGEECALHGVSAIQLVGWNDGGQDHGNPSHDPDPRLGTAFELKQAIAKIQGMGVKVILFAKFTWADRATQWFREELKKLAIKDPYGDYYMHQGYQYQTATQLLDINTKRLIPMCFLSEEYLKICDTEFQKTVDLGADGILFDECLHHSPALLCFDKSHGHRYGAPVYANDCRLIENFKSLLPADKDFLFSGEACYDQEFAEYDLSYHRSNSLHHVALQRYMLPSVPLMTAITGFDDRNMINQCLLYKYIMSYEPYNFKGHLEDFPLTLDYGKKMDSLRSELREYFWDGEFRDVCGVKVLTDNGSAHRPYSVFIAKNGKTGVAIANYDYVNSVAVKIVPDGDIKFTKYKMVEDTSWSDVEEFIKIPPCCAVVVI